ncbi:MAG: hypothetical protein HUU20_00060 [Pirellulales bacterium]|nr:hypothetical protein [Pirellulales bacterium]
MDFAKYFKTAFLNQWNLLAFLGSAAFGVISGRPDIVLPLVAAGELAYLGLLGTHSKFRSYVDAQEAKAARAETTQTSRQLLEHITATLPRELMTRFQSLRAQCAELRQIAEELRRPGVGEPLPLEKFQVAGLDRLLWIYLRLLYTQFSLSRFLQRTREDQIQKDIEHLEGRIQKLPTASTPQAERIRRTLEDNLQTSRSRLENVKKARDNYQLIQLEVERLENKIRSLSELAVNRQEPEFITSEVDHVASSMLETEQTMNELRFATGMETIGEEAPPLMEERLLESRE